MKKYTYRRVSFASGSPLRRLAPFFFTSSARDLVNTAGNIAAGCQWPFEATATASRSGARNPGQTVAGKGRETTEPSAQ